MSHEAFDSRRVEEWPDSPAVSSMMPKIIQVIRHSMLLVVLLAPLVVFGCGKARDTNQAEEASEAANVASILEEGAKYVLGHQLGPKIRRAVLDYAKQALPHEEIAGIASTDLHLGVDSQLITLDLTSGRTVNLIVRLFMRQDGTVYWRVQPLTPEVREILQLLRPPQQSKDDE